MIKQDPELELLTELCRELAALGLSVGLSDAAPAAIVRNSVVGPLYITVDASREFFQWLDAQERHSATDPAGAAAHVVESLKFSDPVPEEER